MSDDIVPRLRVLCNWYDAGYYDDLRRGIREAVDEIERLRAEVERLRAGGCARDQTTTQFCAEAESLRNELAARCGGGGAGPHTTGPTETFIPEAL